MNNGFKRFFFSALAVSYMGFIWIQSSLFNPDRLMEYSNVINYKVILALGVAFELAHLFQFGILYMLLFFALSSFGRGSYWQEVTAVIFSMMYSVLDEVHQMFVPFRSASWVDLLKDFIGIFVFWWIIHNKYINGVKGKRRTWKRRKSD